MNHSIRTVKFFEHGCNSGHCWPVKLTANEVLFLISLKKGIKYLNAKRSWVVKARGLLFLKMEQAKCEDLKLPLNLQRNTVITHMCMRLNEDQ